MPSVAPRRHSSGSGGTTPNRLTVDLHQLASPPPSSQPYPSPRPRLHDMNMHHPYPHPHPHHPHPYTYGTHDPLSVFHSSQRSPAHYASPPPYGRPPFFVPPPWHPHSLIHPPQAPPPMPPPPPPVQHKVWILDCKTCATFLTNRGMKAVLLLRPNVPLYSTDALPVNCSAYSSALPLTPLNGGSHVTAPSRANVPTPAELPRTCECLTQSLCCHGCGAGVGYMIVIPCARCTSSISATNRATNGHRFVFHSAEVAASERHYIHDEPGVLPFKVPLVSPAPVPVHVQNPMIHHPSMGPPYHAHIPSPPPPRPSLLLPHLTSSFPPHPALGRPRSFTVTDLGARSPYPTQLATPPLGSSARSPFASPMPNTPGSPSPTSPLSPNRPALGLEAEHEFGSECDFNGEPDPVPSSDSIDARTHHPTPQFNPRSFEVSVEEVEEEKPERLKEGDVLFWHQLSRSGEIPGVKDNSRARAPGVSSARSPSPLSTFIER